ncbi:MAG: ABC transporter permease, partial [Planctomycetes bacterium]|nr:ABC transporter permease [Planctomycetota bacterium]
LDALWAGDGAAFGDALAHLALPALWLATVPVAVIARITRAAMLDALGQEYVRTARAKGLPWPRVVLRHALKNALLPVLTVAGAEIGALLGGAVLTETVFDWPGMGQYIVRAVESNDYQKIRVGVLMLTVSYVLVNLLTDVLYIVVNPRLRKA